MPRVDRRIRKREAGAAFEEKYGGTHGILDLFLCTGMVEPTPELSSDVEAYCVARPVMRVQMERWMRDNGAKFAERQAKRKAEGK